MLGTQSSAYDHFAVATDDLPAQLEPLLRLIDSARAEVGMLDKSGQTVSLNRAWQHHSISADSAGRVPEGALLLEAQREERKRISLDLRNSTLQYVCAVEQAVGPYCEPNGVPEHDEICSLVKSLLAQAHREVETVSYLLCPPEFRNVGMADAMRDMIEGFAKRTGLDVDLAIEPDCYPDPEADLTLFRVTQEALANIQKHAGASHVWVRLERRASQLRLEVEDNGSGFPARSSYDGPGLVEGVGLNSMRERVTALGGSFSAVSSGGGVLVTAIVPHIRVVTP
jgi:signal transduction histidine kinase